MTEKFSKLNKIIFILFIWLFLVHLSGCVHSGSWVEYEPKFDLIRENMVKFSRAIVAQGECQEIFGDVCPPVIHEIPPHWVNAPVKLHHDQLFKDIFKLLLNKGSEGESIESLYNYVEQVVDYSPKVSHPYYLDRHMAGLDPYGVAADWIVAASSLRASLYLGGPVMTLVEMELAKELRTLIGYPNGQGDFGFTQFPNGFAVQSALQRKFPRIKFDGHVKEGRPRPAIFISDQADFLFEKHAVFQGIGLSGIFRVKSDSAGRMDLNELEKSIEAAKSQQKIPILLVATAGTPILGAIDSIEEMAEIAKKHKMWFHVDGTISGPLIFSENHIRKLKGIKKTDSVTIGAQSLLGAPIEGGIFLTPYENHMMITFGVKNTEYVYKTTTLYDSKWDLGDRTIHTTRRSDGYKVWFMWKAKGQNRLGNHIDYIYDNAQFAIQEIKKRADRGFKLILQNYDSPLVSFYILPSSLRKLDPKSKDFLALVAEFTHKLKNKLLLDGVMQISMTTTTWPDIPDFLTMKLSNSALTKRDITILLDAIQICGDDILDQNLKRKCVRVKKTLEPENYPDFISAPIESMHRRFFEKVFFLILDKALYFHDKRHEPPIKYVSPEKLSQILNLTLGREGIQDEDQLVKILFQAIEYSPHPAHPYWITYEDSPPLAIMEKQMGKAIRNLFGTGWENADVVFPYGGTMGNMMGIYNARNAKFPELKYEGISSQPKIFRVYMNRDAHYSLIKGTFMTGLGFESALVFVPPDNFDRMNVTALRAIIQSDISKGYIPLMVAVSAVDEIADICAEYKIWMHIDGTFGGAYILSDNQKEKEKLKGFERADSFTFNPTKMLSSTLVMTCFVVKKSGLIVQGMNIHSHIEFSNSSKLYDRRKWDQGDNYLEGKIGFTKHLDLVIESAKFCLQELKIREGFEPLLDRYDLTNVLFSYIPPRIRHLDRKSHEFMEEMEKITFTIQSSLVLDGIMIVVSQRALDQSPLLLKFCLMNSVHTKDDMIYLIRSVERYGKNL